MKASTSFSASSISGRAWGTWRAADRPPTATAPGRLGRVLHEHRADGRADHAPLRLAGVRQGVAHEVHPATLPGGLEDLGDGGLDALVAVADDELDAAQAAPVQAAQELRPEGFSLLAPTFSPSTSRWPSVFTPTATITATLTMRPASRVLT
jgi:hypothetical protein